MTRLRGVPRRRAVWAPGTQEEVRSWSSRVRALVGRGIEVAQWGRVDTHAKKMKGALRDVHEIVVDGANVTHRVAYYIPKDAVGPVFVLDAFVKKSTSGVSTPSAIIDRIESRLKRVREG